MWGWTLSWHPCTGWCWNLGSKAGLQEQGMCAVPAKAARVTSQWFWVMSEIIKASGRSLSSFVVLPGNGHALDVQNWCDEGVSREDPWGASRFLCPEVPQILSCGTAAGEWGLWHGDHGDIFCTQPEPILNLLFRWLQPDHACPPKLSFQPHQP